ncbi:universal stress protein [uncultured Aquimarina sp.]|uniref:universal stress protein n=1 Tax=uncultured Aquimarina sp. TaxID=575652 RepID=UPI002607F4D7|nr:universal stress protein [uncultured Aquimarina sp.]
MKNQNLKSKYQLLVLIDLTQKTYPALRKAVNLAKKINGAIDIFYVNPPSEVVKHENQISAMRSIHDKQLVTEKKLKNLAHLISEEENIAVTYDFTFGNIKNEIQHHIEKTNPDIVVIGKRKKKLVNFLEEGVTKFLLKKHSGTILIVGEGEKIQSNNEISLGFYSNAIDDHTVKIVKDLNSQSENPVKFFSVRKKSAAEKTKLAIDNIKTACNFLNAVEYEFEESPYSIDGLSNYVYKNDVELLCMGRFNDNRGWLNKLVNRKSKMDTIIDKLNVSLLVTGGN